MSKANYKGFEIETAQDSLGHWHATVTDTDAGTRCWSTPPAETMSLGWIRGRWVGPCWPGMTRMKR